MACVFDISGRYAIFRKSYTTTSSISFPFPPPTAVAGIIGAILGIVPNAHRSAECADYWNEMGGTRVAIGINRPIKWYRTGINFTNTKSNKTSDHTQIKHQFIKEPSYRIYVDTRRRSLMPMPKINTATSLLTWVLLIVKRGLIGWDSTLSVRPKKTENSILCCL